MGKEYTFATHYTVLAADEEKARETVSMVESILRPDMQVVAWCTRLTDTEDISDGEREELRQAIIDAAAKRG